MAGIKVDVRSDGVNRELALELVEKMLETTKERVESDISLKDDTGENNE